MIAALLQAYPRYAPALEGKSFNAKLRIVLGADFKLREQPPIGGDFK